MGAVNGGLYQVFNDSMNAADFYQFSGYVFFVEFLSSVSMIGALQARTTYTAFKDDFEISLKSALIASFSVNFLLLRVGDEVQPGHDVIAISAADHNFDNKYCENTSLTNDNYIDYFLQERKKVDIKIDETFTEL